MWFTRHKTMMMASGIGLASLVLIFMAVMPIYQSTNTLLPKIKTKSSEAEALKIKVSILSKWIQLFCRRGKCTRQCPPPRKDVLLYLSAINGLSSEVGLKFGEYHSYLVKFLRETKGAKSTKSTGLQSLETEIKMRGEKRVYMHF